MPKKKPSHAGTFRVDRTFTYSGRRYRIQRYSATMDVKEFKAINSMIDMLKQQREFDLLIEMSEDAKRPIDYLRLFTSGKLTNTNTTFHYGPLQPAFLMYLGKRERLNKLAPETAKNYRDKMGWFEKKFPGSAIQDLPRNMKLLQDYVATTGKGLRSFDCLRSMFQGFLRRTDVIGPYHPLYQELSRIERLARQGQSGEGFSVEEYLLICREFDHDRPFLKMFQSMVFTGLRVKEYYEKQYEDKSDRVLIHGTKRAASRRTMFKVGTLVDATSTQKFEIELNRIAQRTGLTITPRLTRKTFALWMEHCGIDESRRKSYIGHAGGLMQKYTTKSVDDYLVRDAWALKNWFDHQVEQVGKAKQVALPQMFFTHKYRAP